jgi:hypothetical protein
MQLLLLSSNAARDMKRGVSSAVVFVGYAIGFVIRPQF